MAVQQSETSRRHQGGEAIYPLAFIRGSVGNPYLDDSAVRTLVDFFEQKGMAALKDEDRLEQWYDDWIEYQRRHGLYATMLSP